MQIDSRCPSRFRRIDAEATRVAERLLVGELQVEDLCLEDEDRENEEVEEREPLSVRRAKLYDLGHSEDDE